MEISENKQKPRSTNKKPGKTRLLAKHEDAGWPLRWRDGLAYHSTLLCDKPHKGPGAHMAGFLLVNLVAVGFSIMFIKIIYFIT